MTTILIDPGLFEISAGMSNNAQMEHFELLDRTISFVSDCMNASLDAYNGAPYLYFYDSNSSYQDAPITRSRYIRNHYNQLRKKIQKLLCKGSDIELVENVLIDCPLAFEDYTITENPFKRYLYTKIVNKSSECSLLLLLSAKNAVHSPSISIGNDTESMAITSIHDPAVDCNNIISKYILKSNNQHTIFPQEHCCVFLNTKFKDEMTSVRLSDAEKKPIFKKYGSEVAYRNGYKKRRDLSKKNPNYSVFIHPYNEFYLSIDLEHGGLEVFKSHGNSPPHIGEYNYSCQKQKDPVSQNHKLMI